MILYTLTCEATHRFDSWFRDSAAYDEQIAAGRVACPNCGTSKVSKAIMAPSIVGGRTLTTKSSRAVVPHESTIAGPTRDDSQSDGSMQDVSRADASALLDDRRMEVRALLRNVREKILANGDDVGGRFPEEARRMHEGDIPTRQIHGQATLAEARDLIEDGIMVLPIPSLPEELN